MAASGVKFLTLEEANALLPAIEGHLRKMDGLVSRKGELTELIEDMDSYWGDSVKEPTNPEHEKYLELHNELAELAPAIAKLATSIHEVGGHLKSYEQGLVDFYYDLGGKVVFLCWQRGEESVEYYHELDTGFQGRRRLETDSGT